MSPDNSSSSGGEGAQVKGELLTPKQEVEATADVFAGLATAMRGIFEPIAASEVQKAEIEDRAHARVVVFQTHRMWAGVGLVVGVFATVALFVGALLYKDKYPEAMSLIGMSISFVGGYGLGKSAKATE